MKFIYLALVSLTLSTVAFGGSSDGCSEISSTLPVSSVYTRVTGLVDVELNLDSCTCPSIATKCVYQVSQKVYKDGISGTGILGRIRASKFRAAGHANIVEAKAQCRRRGLKVVKANGNTSFVCMTSKKDYPWMIDMGNTDGLF